ncbi:AraC family transcriptional regulator [Cohnella thailandensis]|uniref:AraC family transcriptional regulator n=1 Tax=Cohnella thailandensis TaxID=557557 RepID=A0A841SWF8_9BACL|nr:AraC family transcriptional regulator [Cohnella thailandensis]MBB6634508.1 AraC family transcriptional regulator [Cohnella thailandensis]MBP1972938.1 AraC-like DNA-binding protein [Cohnella thailandensis]
MWSRIKPKRMYSAVFLYSCVAVSLLTMTFTLLLSQQFARNAMNEIHKANEEKLNQVVQTSEFTLQKLRQFALRIYSDENIGLWINMNDRDESPLALNKAAASVREFTSSEPFIDGIYLINFQLGQIYASDSSIYTMRDFEDQPLLDRIRNQKTPYLQFADHEAKGESHLALVVPAAGLHQNYSGFVAILFDKPLLNEHMLQISAEDQNKIIVQGPNKEFLLGNSDAGLTTAFMESEKKTAEKSWRWESGRETWSVQTAQLPIEGWMVYHLSPISLWQTKITKIRTEIIGSSIALLLALLMFLFWQSYRSLKPVSDLALQVQRRLGKKHPMAETAHASSDLEWIHSGFDLLADQVDRLDRSIKSSQALVKEDFMRQWILNPQASGTVKAFIGKETSLLRTGFLRIAVIRLESYGRFKENYDFASRQLLRYALGNITVEVLANRGFDAETVDFGSDHLAALIVSSASEDEAARVIEALGEARAQIGRWLKLDLQAAVSSAIPAEDNMHAVYSRMYELTLIGFIHDENRIFTAEDLEKHRLDEDSEPDEKLMKQILYAVHLKNEEALKNGLDRLALQMQSLSYEECKLQLTHLIYSIMKSFKDDKAFRGMSSIHAFLDRFATIGEVNSWLYGELLQIMDRHRRKSAASRKDEVAAEMIEYVRNHLHNPMLSVDDIAAHVAVSVNYARQIFKERFQCSLSDYITGQRIEYAIKLLTTTDLTVADITEQSGFQTKSTFYSLFKRATGMTPNQYRSENAQAKA